MKKGRWLKMAEFPDEYDLYMREVVLKNTGNIQKIFFFVKEGKKPKSGILLSDRIVPAGYEVIFGWNGLPFLKKRK